MEVSIALPMTTGGERAARPLLPAPRADTCIDFVNTLAWRGSEAPAESLTDVAALLDWATRALPLPAATVEPFARRVREEAKEGTALLTAAIALRETSYRIFSAIAARAPIADRDLAAFNRSLGAAPRRERLVRTENGFAWRARTHEFSVANLLAPVLWSAGDLIAAGTAGRLRQCANERCRWFFLDDSKSGTRRWCDMRMCGNRAKARRHYLLNRG
jgi:predicted RNA-binding Zn ribbon-like protein